MFDLKREGFRLIAALEGENQVAARSDGTGGARGGRGVRVGANHKLNAVVPALVVRVGGWARFGPEWRRESP